MVYGRRCGRELSIDHTMVDGLHLKREADVKIFGI
jgi:hypothetical protein